MKRHTDTVTYIYIITFNIFYINMYLVVIYTTA